MSIALKLESRPSAKYGPWLFLLAVLLAVFAFRDSLLELVHRWGTQEEYSHGYFIPVIAGWLAWSRRRALVASIGAPSWTGPVVILLAAMLHIVGELSALYFFSQIAFILTLMGLTLGFGGISLFRVAFIPIVFLAFAIPAPYFIDSTLSWRLQIISSELGVQFIRAAQIPVFLEGNVIDLGQYKLQVVEACSGLRYLYPLLSLGFLAAYLFQAPLWKRAIVFFSTIPITIVMNSFRIGMVGIIVDSFGPQSADGMLHFFEGWIIFIACSGLLALEIFVLARLGGQKKFFEVFAAPDVKPVAPRRPFSARRFPAAIVTCLALVAAVGVTISYVSGRQEILPDRMSFASFPNNIGEWRGRISSMEPQVEHFLGLTDYILSNYSKADNRSVNLYVAYYASQRKGLSPHSPSVCIPGNGWQMSEFERTRYEDPASGTDLPYNRVIVEKDSQRQIVYYWFEQRGRKIENEWVSKWYLLTDAITKNRTDGALVRLVTPIYRNETEAEADRRLQTFIREAVPSLAGYLPSESPAARVVPTPKSAPRVSKL
jgi:exosortase D (VPLPA-CTERM-specific)